MNIKQLRLPLKILNSLQKNNITTIEYLRAMLNEDTNSVTILYQIGPKQRQKIERALFNLLPEYDLLEQFKRLEEHKYKVVQRFLGGESVSKLAQEFKLTRERVYQIMRTSMKQLPYEESRQYKQIKGNIIKLEKESLYLASLLSLVDKDIYTGKGRGILLHNWAMPQETKDRIRDCNKDVNPLLQEELAVKYNLPVELVKDLSKFHRRDGCKQRFLFAKVQKIVEQNGSINIDEISEMLGGPKRNAYQYCSQHKLENIGNKRYAFGKYTRYTNSERT